MTGKPSVDWSRFAAFEKPKLTCRCGAVYRSHCKHTWVDQRFVGVAQDPCPGCGQEFGHIVRAEHPPEVIVLRG